MPRIETSARIAAPPDVVAGVFFDFASYPAWNPLIRSLTAPSAPGTVLTARLQMGPSYAPVLAHPVVLRRSARELVWRGKIVHEVLLSTEHRFACLDAQCAEETEWIHCERFGGLLGWLFVLAFGRTVRETFCRMNERLRELAEDEYARTQKLVRESAS